jgi:cytochrome b6-f complex iron-sulfur subunit
MGRNRKNADDADLVPPRRGFLFKLWLGLGVLALAEVLWLIFSFLRPRRSRLRKGDFGTTIEAGPVTSFEPNSVTPFPRGQFYLARLEDGGFLALSRRCTHLGCTVPWVEEDNAFKCPCHSSAFDIRGNVIRSPAPRALDIFPVTIENDVLKVDTSRMIKRSGFSPGQVTYLKKV